MTFISFIHKTLLVCTTVYKPGNLSFHVICIFINKQYYMVYCGPGSSVGIATELWAGRSGDRIPVGRDFPPTQTGPGAHPASCTIGTGFFPGRGSKVRPGRAADHSPPSSAADLEE